MARLFVALSFFALVQTPAFAESKAYVVSWGYQNGGNRPNRSHTFATFFLVTDGRATEKVTISWLPMRGYLRGPSGLQVPALRPVPGHNYTLAETLQFAAGLGEPVSRFGPYEISLALYDTAKSQAAYLSSGRVYYKMLDRTSRPNAVNCIHAVTDIAGWVATGDIRGNGASRYVISHFAQRGHLRTRGTDEALYSAVREWLVR